METISVLMVDDHPIFLRAVTLLDSDGCRQAALAAGADGFVPKVSVATHLLPAIQRVARARSAAGAPG